MIRYKLTELAGGMITLQTLRVFGYPLWVCVKSGKNGWFSVFGVGITWVHKSIAPLVGEGVDMRKKITIGDYRYGYLKKWGQKGY